MRLIGSAFFVLAAYILVQAIRTLRAQDHPAASVSGIIWLGAAFVAMLLLSLAKRRTRWQLDHAVLMTEAQVTLVDAYLAAAVFFGLVLNGFAG